MSLLRTVGHLNYLPYYFFTAFRPSRPWHANHVLHRAVGLGSVCIAVFNLLVPVLSACHCRMHVQMVHDTLMDPGANRRLHDTTIRYLLDHYVPGVRACWPAGLPTSCCTSHTHTHVRHTHTHVRHTNTRMHKHNKRAHTHS